MSDLVFRRGATLRVRDQEIVKHLPEDEMDMNNPMLAQTDRRRVLSFDGPVMLRNQSVNFRLGKSSGT